MSGAAPDPNQLPIAFHQLFELSRLQINPASIGWGTVAVSEKFVVIRDAGKVVIVDTGNWAKPEIFQIESADSTIPHPSQHVIGVKAGGLVQIYQVQPKAAMLGECNMGQQRIDFWKWIDEKTVAMVTAQAVFHWDYSTAGSAPVKIFDRSPALNDHQIINYHQSYTGTYFALVGITRNAQTGRTIGHAQLYSVAMKGSQVVDGHACCFAKLKRPGQADSVLFCFAQRTDAGNGQLWLVEMGGSHKLSQPIVFPDSNPNDFPLVLVASDARGVLFLFTKEGYFHMCDSLSAKRLMANKVSNGDFFIGGPFEANGGIYGINKQGSVLSISVNPNNMVPYILNVLRDQPLAVSLAQRGDYPGLGPLFQQQFQQCIQQGHYQQAAKLAASSPQGCLRTPATIQLFKSLPATANSAPLRDYYSILLDHGKLNEFETMELVQPVILQDRKDLILDWLQKDKLHCSPELGRLVLRLDVESAILIFKRSGNKLELARLYGELGQLDPLMSLIKDESFQTNWFDLFAHTLMRNPPNAVPVARALIKAPGGPLVDTTAIVDALMERSMVKEATTLLLDVLENKEEHGLLQTRLFEINLKAVPHIANALFENKLFSHYDKQKIAVLCEQVGFYQRALEHYTELSDVRRLLVSHGTTMQIEFVASVFSKFTVDSRLDLMRELMKTEAHNVHATVAVVGVKFTAPPAPRPDPNLFNPHQVVSLFEEFRSYEGTFAYLSPVIALFGTDRDLVFKYIEAAAKLGAIKEIESAVCDYEYDPILVREFLKEARLDNQLPLVRLCDKHNFISDLTHFLYRNNLIQYVQVYVQKVSPLKTPEVIAALLDENAPEETIKDLVASVGHLCPIRELVEEVESRDRLPILTQWLETCFNNGNKEPATHNALAKILISSGDERAEAFIVNNEYYEPEVVGKYAETHNVHLAYRIYAEKKCNAAFFRLTNEHRMFREQAHYLVYQKNPELWAAILAEGNVHRKDVIDQVIQNVVPDVPQQHSELIKITVQAFLQAQLSTELMTLLAKIVLDSPEGKVWDSKRLQTLLILTAIKADPGRVMDYVNRLDGYDPPAIADAALAKDLPEVAFTIYDKFKASVKACEVLVNQVGDLARAKEYADTVNEPAVFSVLGFAQLSKGVVNDAITSFLKANDPSKFENVIAVAKQNSEFSNLVEFLNMCRGHVNKLGVKSKDKIDAELVYAYARTNQIAALEAFVSANKSPQLQYVGESCYNEGHYEAARAIFYAIQNWLKLVSCLVKLKNFSAAIEYARKSGHPSAWKEVCRACVESDPPEFRLAQLCGLNLINHTAQELDELVNFYEMRGYTKQLIELLEAGLTTDTSVHLATALAILYSKYNVDKLLPHLLLFKKKKLTTSKIIQVVIENQQWTGLSCLHELDGDFDKALRVLIEHPDVWTDSKFRELLVKVKNNDLLYEAMKFYLDYSPDSVVELLLVVSNRIDPIKVVAIANQLDALFLVQPFLEHMQEKNIRELNNALNELYIDEEDFNRLRQSIDHYDNFDSMGLAKRLEGSDLLEFRRIAAYLYRLNKRWKQSVDLSKKDKLYKDAMETIGESRDSDLAEELLRFFIEPEHGVSSRHCFAACLYTCYDLINPDIVLELAWRNGAIDFAFPFLIQTVRDLSCKVNNLTKAKEEATSSAINTGGLSLPRPGAVILPGPPGPHMMPPFVPPGAQLLPPGPHVLPPGQHVLPPMGLALPPGAQTGPLGPPMGPPMGGLLPPSNQPPVGF